MFSGLIMLEYELRVPGPKTIVCFEMPQVVMTFTYVLDVSYVKIYYIRQVETLPLQTCVRLLTLDAIGYNAKHVYVSLLETSPLKI